MGESLRDSFHRNAPDGWRQLESAVARIRGSGKRNILVRKDDVDVKRPLCQRLQFSVRDQWVRLEVEGCRTGEQAAFGVNSKYGFRLGRPNADARYAVETIDSLKEFRSGEINGLSQDAVFIDTSLMEFLNAGWTLDSIPLRDLVSRDGFKIEDIGPVDEGDGTELVRVAFHYRSENSDSANYSDAWMILAPQQKWALRRYESRTSWGRIACSSKFRVLEGEQVVPERVEKVLFGVNADSAQVQKTFDFDEIRQVDTPEDEFRLTSFGIPETLAPVPAEGNSVRVYLLAASVILLSVLGILLLRRSIRQRSR